MFPVPSCFEKNTQLLRVTQEGARTGGMRAAARRVGRGVRELAATTTGRTLCPYQGLQTPNLLFRTPGSPGFVRWVVSAVPAPPRSDGKSDGTDRRGRGGYGETRGSNRGGHGDVRVRPSDGRPGNHQLRDIQRKLVDALDVRTILGLCDPGLVNKFSAVNVSTALSKMAKNAKRTRFVTKLDHHPSLVALCERALELLKMNQFPHRPVCNSAHALATLQQAGVLTVTEKDKKKKENGNVTPAQSVWRALFDAMPRVASELEKGPPRDPNALNPNALNPKSPNPKLQTLHPQETSARQSTMFLYAAALVKEIPCDEILAGIWNELGVDESRIASHHVSNLVWSLGTLQLDPGLTGWGIIDRAVPSAFANKTEFNSQNVANTWWGFARLRRAPNPESVKVLSAAIVTVQNEFKPQELANCMWARATLSSSQNLPVEQSVKAAFDSAAVTTLTGNSSTQKFKAKELSQIFWHYASLGVSPPQKLWLEMDSAARRLAPFQSPMDVSLVLWACATLDLKPSLETWLAMERRLADLVKRGFVGSGPGGVPSERLVRKEGDDVGRTRDTTLPRSSQSQRYTQPQQKRSGDSVLEWQQVSNLVWSYAKLRVFPDRGTKNALDDAFHRLAHEKPESITAQDTSMLLWGYVTLGFMPGVGDDNVRNFRTLFDAVDRHANVFKPDELTNALWCLAVWRAVEGSASAPFPKSYNAMWQRLAVLESTDFSTSDGVLIAHHAATVHNELLTGVDELPVMKQSLIIAAETAWKTQSTQHSDPSNVSGSQGRVGAVLSKIGFKYQSELELFGGRGFFQASQTVDFFLPDWNVVVEYDGPHHFYDVVSDPKRARFHNGGLVDAFALNAHTNDLDHAFTPNAHTTNIDPGVTKNVNTRLRDLFLAKKENVQKVVSLPWWEMRLVKHGEQEKWLEGKVGKAIDEVKASREGKGVEAIRGVNDVAIREVNDVATEKGVDSSFASGSENPNAGNKQSLCRRWIDACSVSQRIKLEVELLGADDDARWRVVRAAAGRDATKVRAALRGEIETTGE